MKECMHPQQQVTHVTKLYAVVHHICRSSVWNLHHLNLPMPRILENVCTPEMFSFGLQHVFQITAHLGLGYTRDWLPAGSFVARAWAMVLNGRAHTVRHVRGKTKLSSSSADSPRQLCVRTVGRLEK
jgi:hypothetical protein